MNFVHNLLTEEFVIDEGELAVIVFEDIDSYVKLLNEIIDSENNFHFYSKLKSDSKYLLIDNFMLMNLNERKILNYIYKDLSEYKKKEEFYGKYLEINSLLVSNIEKMIFDSDLPLEIDYDFDIKNIFKAYNLRVSEDFQSLTEKLIDYIELNIRVFGYKIIVMFNMCLYFKKEEIKEIKKIAEFNELIIVDIERVYFDYTDLGLKYLVFDESLSRVL